MLHLGDAPTDLAALGPALDAKTGANRDTAVFLRADASVDYAGLMRVLDALRGAGYLKVALVGLEAAP